MNPSTEREREFFRAWQYNPKKPEWIILQQKEHAISLEPQKLIEFQKLIHNKKIKNIKLMLIPSSFFLCVCATMARRQMSDKSVALWNSSNIDLSTRPCHYFLFN